MIKLMRVKLTNYLQTLDYIHVYYQKFRTYNVLRNVCADQ
jgi:hypothetical protein